MIATINVSEPPSLQVLAKDETSESVAMPMIIKFRKWNRLSIKKMWVNSKRAIHLKEEKNTEKDDLLVVGKN